jgi:hypothetical protein
MSLAKPLTPVTTTIDRRVLVIDGSSEQRAEVTHVSDLRALSFVVLLGEPGIGKSTVFAAEAALEGVPVASVRELITSAPLAGRSTLFLDALDEYRSEGASSDKIYTLAQSMVAAHASRWRIACRSEDWRAGADSAALAKTAAATPVVVARLLPLNSEEASEVLVGLGENEPTSFLAKAHALGASGFVESPLSLKLLHKAVSRGGVWPHNRYELFASAIQRLAHEHNEEHRWGPRSSPDDIVTAAARACLMLLVSGARAIWQPNNEPASDSPDTRAFLTTHDLDIDYKLLRDVLDTALFRGDGQSFEPMHRTIAEFLGAQELARAVCGTNSRVSIPLRRALALVGSAEGAPVTETRGLFAWFAAHLAKLGAEFESSRLIDSDAATVLLYGDAAVFSRSSRQALFERLDRDDPYFLASGSGVTAVGGLAGEDLAADFAAALNEPRRSHSILTVFDALTVGPPVLSLRPLLRGIALDPARPEWQRWRAADAWLNGVENAGGARRELFDALAGEVPSAGRETLRVHLAKAFSPRELRLDDVKSIIADLRRVRSWHTFGKLFPFRRKLEISPPVGFFDEPISTWMPRRDQHPPSHEIDDFIDHLLAASIRHAGELEAERLWRWIINLNDAAFPRVGDKSAIALREWLDADAQREIDIFDAIVATRNPQERLWAVLQDYHIIVRRTPTRALVQHVLDEATARTSRSEARDFLEIAVAMARDIDIDIDTYWLVYDVLERRRGCKTLLKRMAQTKIEDWRLKRYQLKRNARRQAAKAKELNLKLLVPLHAELRRGCHLGHLHWAADLYSRPKANDEDEPAGMERVVHFSSAETAEAISEGWKYLATNGTVGVDSTLMGRLEATNETHFAEKVIVAGLDLLLDQHREPPMQTIEITSAIAALKSSWCIGDIALEFDENSESRRQRLEKWALARLNFDPRLGADELVSFCLAALDTGATRIGILDRLSECDAMGEATKLALEQLIAERRSMPAGALRSALRAAITQIDPQRLSVCCQEALSDEALRGEQRTIWGFVALALDPVGQSDAFMARLTSDAAETLLGDNQGEEFVEWFRTIDADTNTRALRESLLVRILGPCCSPEDERRNGAVTWAHRSSSVVRSAISWLASNCGPEPLKVLTELQSVSNLLEWHESLRHAKADQARTRRDRDFTHPTASQVRAVLDAGPPINASDLRAVVQTELERLRTELRTDLTPWKQYWNVGQHGNVEKPLIENECRDRLLERLRDRVARYGITLAIPEMRRGEQTRADIVILTGAGRNLPVEIKRESHADLWTAASTQLQGYASDEGAGGFGIYLVFWFNTGATRTPARPSGAPRPRTAVELEKMLEADLPLAIRPLTDVMVFDVSDPKAHERERTLGQRSSDNSCE